VIGSRLFDVRLIAIVMLGLLAWATPMIARAQSCTVATTSVTFGAYDPTSATPRDINGAVQVDCFLDTVPVTIALDDGLNGTFANRKMVSGAFSMTYNLYTNASRSIVWGNGTAGTQTVTCTTGVTNGACAGSFVIFNLFSRTVYPVYGRIPTTQDVAVGTYSDTVQVTVTF
jgi:spore coat protein U-like protein